FDQFLELSSTKVAKDDAGREVVIPDFGINTAGDAEDIGIPVIIEVGDAGAPGYKPRLHANARAQCLVPELALSVVDIQGGCVVRKVSLEDVQVATQAEIADTEAHAGLYHAILAEGHAALDRLFGESPVVVVVKHQAGCGVAGDIDIRPAIV